MEKHLDLEPELVIVYRIRTVFGVKVHPNTSVEIALLL